MKDRNTEKELYHNDITYGTVAVSMGLKHAITMMSFPPLYGDIKKMVVVGGGNNYEGIFFNLKGVPAYSLDLFSTDVPALKGKQAVGVAQSMPFKDKAFDLYFCCEVLEHIPEELIDDILKECKRVARKCLFSIATANDAPYHSHINIHDGVWWIKKFIDAGFHLINAQVNVQLPFMINSNGHSIMGLYMMPHGVTIHADC
jgi:hypothetical protein